MIIGRVLNLFYIPPNNTRTRLILVCKIEIFYKRKTLKFRKENKNS